MYIHIYVYILKCIVVHWSQAFIDWPNSCYEAAVTSITELQRVLTPGHCIRGSEPHGTPLPVIFRVLCSALVMARLRVHDAL